jgi:hypothetical protein
MENGPRARAHSSVNFHNPDFVKYAESYGAKGYKISRPGDLLPTLESALEDDNSVSVIACPVDYSENNDAYYIGHTPTLCPLVDPLLLMTSFSRILVPHWLAETYVKGYIQRR